MTLLIGDVYKRQGREKIDYLFSGFKNATLVGYVPEVELKHYMNDSDISLNVMKDTICLLYTSRCV